MKFTLIPFLYRTYPLLVPVGIFLLGLALRVYCLDCRSLWGDEIASVEMAQRGLSAIFTDRFGWMHVQTPLHYLLVWLTLQPVDPVATSALVRLPSALAGALTVLVVYGLGREMFGRVQGLIAAVLLALSPVHLNYSQDLRPYAMLTFLTAASLYALLMAERTGSRRWWLAFAAAAIANVLNAYVALTLVLPALAPYLLWVLWKLWSHRGKDLKPLLYAILALAAVGMASLLVLADMLQVPRIAPDLGQYSPALLLTSVVELVNWFAQFGIGGQFERLLQLALLLLALGGAYLAFRRGRRDSVFICLLFLFVPSALLSVLSTTNAVFQRYALFALPFYFLLVSNGLAPEGLKSPSGNTMWPAGIRLLASRAQAAAVTLAVLLSTFATGIYFSPAGAESLAYRPDFRGVAGYLSDSAHQEDVIIFVGWDSTVSAFYWRGAPPATVYGALDPRLYTHESADSLYWVVSYDGNLSPQMLNDPLWSEVRHYDSITVLRESGPNVNILASMERMAAGFEDTSVGGNQLFRTLRGSLYQARGEIDQAARSYSSAGTYFPSMGEEYLRTARGFAERGDVSRAWRDAMVSKGMQPQNAELHAWMSQMLSDMGLQQESRIEARIADALAVR